ncbi:MAG: hypothetical protein HFG75_09705 [Hungatella sp.]|nr:hypothetical protein [Hungatella sp.]
MRELSVYYCDKCGYYAYFQLPKNAVCHLCARPMIRLDMNHRDFTSLGYEDRDRLIALKMVAAAPTLASRITAPEKLYCQRKLVGTLTQHVLELEKEIAKLNETVEWMHSTIWDELRKKQELKEEVRHLKKLLDIQQEDR